MENRKRYLSLLLAVLLCLSLLPVNTLASDELPEDETAEAVEEAEVMPTAAAASVVDEPEAELSAEESLTAVDGETNVYSGTCGENVAWTLNTETGVLTISGTGDMRNYSLKYVSSPSSGSTAPWTGKEIKHVIIRTGVTSIGDYAFRGKDTLEDVTIPDSVTKIGSYAFQNCKMLSNVIFPEEIADIGSYAFAGCVSLTEISLGGNVESCYLGYGVFANCVGLEKITLKNGITYIPVSLFSGCTALEEVSMPDAVVRINHGAFEGCSRLSHITIPESVDIIESCAFAGCTNLEYITIPNTVSRIGADAFRSCAMSEFQIPDEATFENNPFGCCKNLERFIVSDNNPNYTAIDGVLFNKDASCLVAYPNAHGKSYTLPETVTRIGSYAFYGCSDLSGFIVKDGVTRIGERAFEGCSELSFIVIPQSLTQFDSEGGLTFCGSLDIYYFGSEADWDAIKNSWLVSSSEITLHYNSAGPEQSVHTIYSSSSNGKDRYFKFRENEEVEDLVLSTAATEYNPRLAHMLCVMARAAYDQPLVRSNLEEMGFFVENELISGTDYYEDYADDTTVAFSLAKKTLADGSTFVMITIRGTFNWSVTGDGIRNADIGIAALNGFGKHEGFQIDAEKIYSALRDLLGGIPTSDITYVITGHSQGAAAGNLLAVMLYDNGVPSSCVYDYNFACPNVACLLNPNDWNPGGAHNNIFNIGNVEDPVTYLPSNLVKIFIPRLSPLSTWGKFGRSYWFYPDVLNHNVAGHDMIFYDNELSAVNPLSSFVEYGQIAGERILRVIGVHCPVDVIVYDASGTPIAGVIDNEACYYNSSFGEVMIFVEGDEKWIYIPNDQNCEIRLSATDEGEMQYEVYDVNFTNEEVINEKTFESVVLTDGKEMVSYTDDSLTIPNVALYVVGDTGNAEAAVQENGTETAIPPGDIDGDGAATMSDAARLLRYLDGQNVRLIASSDVNGDGTIDSLDPAWLMQYLVGYNVTLH